MDQPATLIVDIGGNKIKLALAGREERRKAPSAPDLTPERAMEAIRELAADWHYDRVTLGCPGPVRDGRLVGEPVNLGRGWVGFDFAAAFERPVKLVNDALLQAIGSWEGGKMLFLGLGTGLGSALVAPGVALALELAHLPYKRKWTYEDCLGRRGLQRMGRKRWERMVWDVVARFRDAFLVDEVVLGGGNAKRLRQIPEGCRLGSNALAVRGGLRVWTEPFRFL
ncbi:MAG TPA: ROK family protein [Rhodospirillales bacterium]|nr:ROK family protein [Rhodospirillales bacterium]